MPQESFWKGWSMQDMPAGLEPKPGAEDCAHPLGSALVSPPPGSLPGCPAGICNDSEAPGAWPASSWRSCRCEEARGHLRVGARHGQQPGAQNRDGEASLRSQNQTRSGGAHSAEKMLRLEERAWRGLSPRVLGRALR